MNEPKSTAQSGLDIAGLITKSSRRSVEATISRFEEALKARGFMLFARLDHAAAAKTVGLEMPGATVIVFGNPRLGTPAFLKSPTLGIDFPLKAMVWEDARGQVFLSYNSANYFFNTIYSRHGATQEDSVIAKVASALETIADEAVS